MAIASEQPRRVTGQIAKPILNAQATTAGELSTRLEARKRSITTAARDIRRATMDVDQPVRSQRHEPTHPAYRNVTWQDHEASQVQTDPDPSPT